MNRPLYNTAVDLKRPHDAHWGLWFDKFCDAWRVIPRAGRHPTWTLKKDDRAKDRAPSPKLKWLQTLPSPMGDLDLLREHASRVAELSEGRGGTTRVFETRSRLLTGLGRRNPTENGFTWHPTLGVPYLPGSSVKGVVRSWAKEIDADEKEIQRLFGTQEGAGQVIFLDALPIDRVKVVQDVMTPHNTAYLQRGEQPGDWEDPNPIPIMAIDKGNLFTFSVLPRTPDERSVADLETIIGWLTEALSWIGAGAKTSVGYGRFAPVDLEETAWGEALLQRRRARWERDATPADRWARRVSEMSERKQLDLAGRFERDELEGGAQERDAARQALRATEGFARWRRGEVLDSGINLSEDKIKERARALMTEEEREEFDAPDLKEQFDATLTRLTSTTLVDILNEEQQLQRFPKPWLMTLANKATREAPRKSKKLKAAKAFKTWVKALPDPT